MIGRRNTSACVEPSAHLRVADPAPEHPPDSEPRQGRLRRHFVMREEVDTVDVDSARGSRGVEAIAQAIRVLGRAMSALLAS